MKRIFFVSVMLLTVFPIVNAMGIRDFEKKTLNPVQSGKNDSIPPPSGDYYDGLTRKIEFNKMIPPHGLEVTYNKTTHIIFPSRIRYVDLGSSDLIAGKAGESDNVLRVKSAIKSFRQETNMAVITEDGSYYTFNVKYAKEPVILNIEMKDFIYGNANQNCPNNRMAVYLAELGNESPRTVNMINRSIYKQDKKYIKHIGSKRFGIQFLLKGIYSHNNLLYLHTEIKNPSNVAFDVDFIRMKVVDKKVTTRTTIQETMINPLRMYNFMTVVDGKKSGCSVFTIDKITIPDDKQLIIELFEKNGGRNQSFIIENSDLLQAREINDLKLK